MKIFLSYTSADRAWAQWIGVTLRDAGREVFVHEWEVGAGENIPAWMEDRVGQADKMVGVFSPAYVAAVHSNAERWAAYWHDPDGRNGFLVPIEVVKLDKWPVFAANKRRLSLIGKTEGDAERDLVAFFVPPSAPEKRPPFPGGGSGGAAIPPGPALGATTTADAAGYLDPAIPNSLFTAGGEGLPTRVPSFPREEAIVSESHVRIANVDELRAWLDGQSRDVAMIITARVVMRIAPLLAQFRLKTTVKQSLSDALLRLWHAIVTPWNTIKYSSHDAEFRASFGVFNFKKTNIDDDNYIGAYSTVDAFAYEAAAAITYTYAAYAMVATDAAVTLITDLAAAALSAAYAAYAAYAGTTATTPFWLEISFDVMVVDKGLSPAELANCRLWPLSGSNALGAVWADFSRRLQATDEDWDVWTTWYDDRLAGRPPDWEKEVARLTLPEAMWQQGAKIANAEIKRRFAEIDARREREEKPERPKQERGQTFHVAERGLEATAGPRPIAQDGLTLRLHDQIRRHAAEVRLATSNIGNRLALLSRTIDAYASAVAPEFTDLDLFALWSAGVSLIEMTDAQRREKAGADNALDAEKKGLLQALAALHSNLIHRIPEIRDEFNVPEIERSSGAVLAAIKPPMRSVLHNLRNLERGIESKTKRLLQVVSIGYEASEGDYPEGVKSAYLSLSDALIAISDHIDAIETATPTGCSDVVEAVIVTDPEDTRALLQFFRANETEIRAFSEPFSKLGIWIDWVYSRLSRLNNF